MKHTTPLSYRLQTRQQMIDAIIADMQYLDDSDLALIRTEQWKNRTPYQLTIEPNTQQYQIDGTAFTLSQYHTNEQHIERINKYLAIISAGFPQNEHFQPIDTITYDEFTLWRAFRYFFAHFRQVIERTTAGVTNQTIYGRTTTWKWSGNYNNDNLVQFFLYLNNPTPAQLALSHDYRETHDVMKTLGIEYKTPAFKIQLGTLTIKAFQNGRLDIADLTLEQFQTITRLIEVHDRITHSHTFVQKWINLDWFKQ